MVLKCLGSQENVNDCITEVLNSFFDVSKDINNPLLTAELGSVKDSEYPIPLNLQSHTSFTMNLNRQGKQWLDEAMISLGLKSIEEAYHTFESADTEEIESMKRRIKAELRAYDDKCKTLTGKDPCRVEKEPMRPLYALYKRLGQLLTSSVDRSSTEFTVKEAAISKTTNAPSIFSAGPSDPFNALRIEYGALVTKKQSLRIALSEFQNSFVSENRRPIKFKADIAPVADKYRQYRELKLEISRLEEKLGISSTNDQDII